MSIKLKPTTGPWTAKKLKLRFDVKPLQLIDDTYTDHGLLGEDDAKLIAEAGTVFHETGLTPRELKEQRDRLLDLLKASRILLATHNKNYDLSDIDIAIANVEFWNNPKI